MTDTDPGMESAEETPTPPSRFWWARHIVGTLLSAVFLAFGVEVLVAAYGLTDPFLFVMTFFSANFIILISGALAVGLVWRMVDAWRAARHSH
jgi:hypothetical protein